MSSGTTRAAVAAGLLAVAGCGISPLSHRIHIGEDPFVVFVATGVDGHTDLFAAPAGGGDIVQFTFTPLVESSPRLRPDGEVVAFLRGRDTAAAAPRDVVLMNLVSSGETDITLPADAGRPQALAWSRDAARLYLRTDRGLWQVTVPPGPPHPIAVAPADTAAADSALAVWLGDPPFARAIRCPAGGVCIVGPKGDTTTLAPQGRDPVRWGADSVAWFDNDNLQVRSLGPGVPHRVVWRSMPQRPRQLDYVPAPSDTGGS